MTAGLFGSSVLDLAIGLAFIYLLLAIICTAINEWVAGCLKTRGKLLARGIAGLLDGQPVPGATNLLNAFYDHPLIGGLMGGTAAAQPAQPAAQQQPAATQTPPIQAAPKPAWSGRHPSYIPARTFSAVLLHLMTPTVAGTSKFEEVCDGLAAMPDGKVKRALLALAKDARGDLDTFQRRIEAWYDDAMDRVTGSYKRQTQLWTIAIALALTVTTNADTLHIARRLWTDPALRSEAVADATIRRAEPPPSIESAAVVYKDRDPLKPSKPKPPAAGGAGAGGAEATISPTEQELLGKVLGWHADAMSANSGIDWFERIVGWILSIVAISLGAPFWFDTLNRFMNVRSAGRSPDEAAKTPEKKKLPPADRAA